MGPRPNGRGKRPCGLHLFAGRLASMGPRPNGRGKGYEPDGGDGDGGASMGPRPNGRGKTAPPRTTCKSRGVNGAAAKRPRKAAWARPRALPAELASMGPRPNGRGKFMSTLSSALGLIGASMGPRPNGRGKSSSSPSRPPTTRVNGAAAKRPRKDQICVLFLHGVLLRQWGRGQTAAESRKVSTCTQPPSLASMGPRPNGRGKVRQAISNIGRGGTASMGPRPNGRGKHVQPRRPPGRVGASMGPRPNGRGKAAPAPLLAPSVMRQWGRGQTAAESRYGGPR